MRHSRNKQKRGRVYGPYKDKNGWRVVAVDSDGVRTSQTFATEEEAERERNSAESELEAEVVSVSKALDLYHAHQLTQAEKKPRSITTTMERLRSLPLDQDEQLGALTQAACQAAYNELAGRVAVDTHRNTLNEWRTCMRWAIRRGYAKSNPFEEVEAKGKRKKGGKPKLRITEARIFWDVGVARARAGERAALGALVALHLGLRAGEILRLQARDVDDGGRVIWIDEASTDDDGLKSDASQRALMVEDEDLVELLATVAEEGGPLFPTDEHQWLNREVARICYVARVPRVCTHGLRATHAAFGTEFGSSSAAVSKALGHANERVTREHYAGNAATAAGVQRRAAGRMRKEPADE